MCTSPIKILNPSTFISPDSGQKLYYYVPCGKCLDCRQSYQNEWRLRVYSEFIDCINSNGYVLFDTLTYSSEFLPRLSDMFDVPKELDFPCFRSCDIQLFMKRLRNNLKKLGYDCKNQLRYFIVSEYGTDDRYTHRPHYHVFFFVWHSFVPFYILSESVAKSWSIYNEIDKTFTPIGLTDGLPYKSFSYVRQHNTFDTLNDNCKRIALYLAKYVSKDFAYIDLVDKRLKAINDYYCSSGFSSNDKLLQIVKDMSRFVSPFHRQSLNFGVSCLDIDMDELINYGIKFYDNGLPLYYPVFPNFKRRLFYRYSRDYLGVVHWKKKAIGLKRDLHFLSRQFSFFNARVNAYNDNNPLDKINVSAMDNFNLYRLMNCPCSSIDEAQEVLKSEYLVDVKNGYRNYCCHGFSFVNSKVFSKLDYGLRKRKYFYPKAFNVHRGTKVLYPLESFDILNYRCLYNQKIDDELKKLYSYSYRVGKEKLAVARHQERIKNKLKQFNLC